MYGRLKITRADAPPLAPALARSRAPRPPVDERARVRAGLAPALAKFLSGVSIMGFRYAIIGSGRQGTAAAYDLALLGDAEYVLMADRLLANADRTAQRGNQ